MFSVFILEVKCSRKFNFNEKFNPQVSDMQIITQFHEFLVKRMLISAKALIYGNRIVYFYIIVELSNVVNKDDVARTATKKLHGRVKMTPIRYNGAPKWHTKQC